MKELQEFSRILDNLNKLYPTLPNRAATVAVNFTKERFREESWLDSSKEKWDSRKINKNQRDRSRKILTKTGKLKRSVRKDRVTSTYAVIAVGGTGIEYAQIHNEGGRIQGEIKIREHTRRLNQNTKVQSTNLKTRKTTSRNRRVQTGETKVKSHIRKVNFIMPKRQFIGNSATLDKRIQLQITADIVRALKS